MVDLRGVLGSEKKITHKITLTPEQKAKLEDIRGKIVSIKLTNYFDAMHGNQHARMLEKMEVKKNLAKKIKKTKRPDKKNRFFDTSYRKLPTACGHP